MSQDGVPGIIGCTDTSVYFVYSNWIFWIIRCENAAVGLYPTAVHYGVNQDGTLFGIGL